MAVNKYVIRVPNLSSSGLEQNANDRDFPVIDARLNRDPALEGTSGTQVEYKCSSVECGRLRILRCARALQILSTNRSKQLSCPAPCRQTLSLPATEPQPLDPGHDIAASHTRLNAYM